MVTRGLEVASVTHRACADVAWLACRSCTTCSSVLQTLEVRARCNDVGLGGGSWTVRNTPIRGDREHTVGMQSQHSNIWDIYAVVLLEKSVGTGGPSGIGLVGEMR